MPDHGCSYVAQGKPTDFSVMTINYVYLLGASVSDPACTHLNKYFQFCLEKEKYGVLNYIYLMTFFEGVPYYTLHMS